MKAPCTASGTIILLPAMTCHFIFALTKTFTLTDFMYKNFLNRAKFTKSVIALSALIFFASCEKLGYFPRPGDSKGDLGNLKQVNLVANNESYGAKRVDPLLLNAWGLAFSKTGLPWI